MIQNRYFRLIIIGFILILAVFLTTGCPEPGVNEAPPVLIEVNPEISIKHGDFELSIGDNYTFGSVETGTYKEIIFTVENNADDDLILVENPDLINISGNDAAYFSVTKKPSGQIAGNTSSSFIIRFTASSEGNKSAVVTVQSNDRDESAFIFSVTALSSNILNPGTADIDIQYDSSEILSGSSFSAGYFEENTTYNLEFTVRNSAAQKILSFENNPQIRISGDSEFTISQQPEKFFLLPGETSTFTIQFIPSGSSEFETIVSVSTNDINDPAFTFTLSGRGIIELNTPPADGGTTIDTTPALSWSPASYADSYRLLVDDNSDFSSPVADKSGLPAPSYTLNGFGSEMLVKDETYYWKVAPVDSEGVEGSYSNTSSFSVVLTAPVPLSPSDGAATVDTSPLIAWEPVAGAPYYNIQINTQIDFSAGTMVTVASSLTEPQYPVPELLNNNAAYYWRVSIINNDNVNGDFCAAQSFDVNLQPELNSAPEDNYITIETGPLFDWDDIAGADNYHIQINTLDDFTGTTIADDNTLIVSEYQPGSALPVNTYYWRLRLKNEDNIWGNWSSAKRIDIKQAYNLRETGPAGGLIFYDKGNYNDGWRYMEAAPSNQSTSCVWGPIIDFNIDATAVGTGKTNTQAIVSSIGGGTYAASVCNNLNLGGKTDWFLPSMDELNLMYTELKLSGYGGFASQYYWTSSEKASTAAVMQHFGTGGQVWYYNKDSGRYVRAARMF